MRFWMGLVGSSILALQAQAQTATASASGAPVGIRSTDPGQPDSSSAQSAPGERPSDPGQGDPDRGGLAQAGQTQSDRSDVGDIIVTANRRTEKLQAVPITVTVVSGEQLTRQNVNSVENLARSAPALSTAGPPGYGALSIRGVGGISFSSTTEGSVGVVVDGVSLANLSTNPPLLFDVARVEVLEGPQGTLFGRNSSAGVLNITTVAPDPTKIELIAHTDTGTRNNTTARGVLNLPLAANAALRVSAAYSRDPDVQQNLADGSYQQRATKSARGRFLWEPGSGVTVNLSGDYTKVDVSGGSPWLVYASSAASLLTARLRSCGVTIAADNQKGCTGTPSSQSIKTFGTSGQIDVDLGGPTLTSISAYRGLRSNQPQDLDSTTANRLFQQNPAQTDNFSQEFRVSSRSGGLIEYVGGVYYFRSKIRNALSQVGQVLADLPLVGACPLPAAALCGLTFGQDRRFRSDLESYAGFGQVTINATDRFRVILGGRVGHEDVRANVGATTLAAGAFAQFAPGVALNLRTTDTYFSYRGGVQYDLTPRIMAFATYTRGYKGPAVNDGATLATIPLIVRPEIPKAGEVGIKTTLFGGRAGLNATAFYTKVTDFQAQFYDNSLGGAFIYGNAPSLTSKGVSVNAFGRPVRGLSLNTGVTLLDTSYGPGYVVANFINVPTDVEGRTLTGTSRWKVTGSAEYAVPLGDRHEGYVQLDMVYRSKYYANAANDAILSTPGAAIFGGRIGARTSDGRFGVSLYARNIFDVFRPTARFATPVGQQQLDFRTYSQFIGPEANRVIGLSLDLKL